MTSLSRFVIRRARLLLTLGVVFSIVAGVVGHDVAQRLGPYSATDPATESVRATDRLAAATGLDVSDTLVVLVDLRRPARSPAGRRRVLEVTRQVRATPGLGAVAGPFDGHERLVRPRQISRDGTSGYVIGRVAAGATDKSVVRRLQQRFPAGGDVTLGGVAGLNVISNDIVEKDLRRAELIAFPLVFLFSLLFFRSLVAAALPLVVGGVATVLTFFLLRIVSDFVGLSVYALNLVTALGLGLAIDWSLFTVSRYREQLASQGPGAEALTTTLRTAGRTVLFSGLTVAAALCSLLIFPQRFLYSMGLGGALVAIVAAATAMLLLPALLWVLGPRVNALAPGWLRRRADTDASTVQSGSWYRLAKFVTARPRAVTAASVIALLAVGLPATHVKFTAASVADLPSSTQPRHVADALKGRFAASSVDEVIVASGADTAANRVLRRSIAALESVRSVGRWERLQPRLATLAVISAHPPLSPQTQDLVRRIRALPGAGAVEVAGTTAAWVDEQSSLRRHLPVALAILVVTTMLILLAMTGSVVLPLKALVMNALTLAAAFGVLVVVFQEGHLAGLLGVTAQGMIESSQPVVLAAVAFGLSTDYGVFLLARIKEARDAGVGDTEAVAFGLERTGRLVSSAAVLFCIAIGAMVSSEVVFIKELALGTVVAVLIDATLVRALLVPSLMALLGRWNWWAPRIIRKFVPTSQPTAEPTASMPPTASGRA